MPWRPEFAASGNYGGHTDVVTATFVRNYVARRVMGGPPPGK